MKELADIAAMGLEFPFVGIAAKKSYIKDNMDTVQRFVRAYTEAIAIYKNNRELAMKVTSKYTGMKDPALLGATVDFYAPKLQRVPHRDGGGFEICLGRSRGARSARQKLTLRRLSWTRASSNSWTIAAISSRFIRRAKGAT